MSVSNANSRNSGDDNVGGENGGYVVNGSNVEIRNVSINSDTSSLPSVEVVSNFMSEIRKPETYSAGDGTDVDLVTLDESDLVEVEE